jgi:hypothetical protein
LILITKRVLLILMLCYLSFMMGESEWGAEPYKIPLVIEKEEELEVAVEQREGEGNRELRRTSFVSESARRNVGTDLEAKCPNE